MKVWIIRAGRFGEHETLALDKGLSVIGFYEMPDLSQVDNQQTLRELCQSAYPNASIAKISNFVGQLFSFVKRIEVGDLIALPRKSNSTIALGRVTGAYQYRNDLGDVHHVRPVSWLRTDVPRTDFGQDLLYSLGAFMTVCRIERNNAEARFQHILDGGIDPALTNSLNIESGEQEKEPLKEEMKMDVEQLAQDQILTHIELNFKGHNLARLVEAVLKAEGYETYLSPPGPDGGVDILAGRGALGFEHPRLCVQVKSSSAPCDVTIFRGLQGTMATFKADQGLLVSWGGFNTVVRKEARLSFFSVRLWDASDLVSALLRNYDQLPEDLQAELPLKRIWTLVLEE